MRIIVYDYTQKQLFACTLYILQCFFFCFKMLRRCNGEINVNNITEVDTKNLTTIKSRGIRSS